MWRETATSGRGRAPRSVRTSPLHPGGWPSQPAGRAPGPPQRAWGLGVDVDTRRPALTPGGRPRPGPRQGRRGGAVPRKGLQGPRTKRPHWGRRASGRRRGREITFWGPSGCSRSARSLFKGGPTPSPKVDVGVLPEGLLPQPRAPHLSLFPLGSTGRAKGPAFPPRGSSTKPGRGRGRAIPGSTRVEAAARAGRARPRSRPSAGSTTSAAPKLGSCGALVFGGQLPGTFRCQLGPAPSGQPTGSRGPHLRRHRDPSAAPAPAPRPTSRPRCAQTRLRRRGWAPGLRESALN